MFRSKFSLLLVAGALVLAAGGSAVAQDRKVEREAELGRSAGRAQVHVAPRGRLVALPAPEPRAPAMRPQDRDFRQLRDAGLEYVEAGQSSELWTDHNTHDPGITMMEMLCYAITDLGNRTNCPVAPLLPSELDERKPE
jgi:hypothetical protein